MLQSPPTTDRQQQVVDLLYRYVRLVDSRDVTRWPDFFAEEAEYFVQSRENVERNLPVAFVYDDTRDRIDDRVTFLKEIWTDYDDYWPRHILSTVQVELDGQEARLFASFAFFITDHQDGGTRLLVTGEYQDLVVFVDGQPLFKSKKVILDTSVLPRYFVYPL